MIFGHLTATAAGHHLLRRRWPDLPVPLVPLVVGAYLPDLLDKPLALVTGLSGRGYAHSLVLQLLVFGVAALALRCRGPNSIALALGAALHLLEDWVALEVLVAPLLGPIPETPMRPFFEKLVVFYTSGSVLMWIEVAAVLYWLGVGATALAARSTARRDRRASSQRMPSSSAL